MIRQGRPLLGWRDTSTDELRSGGTPVAEQGRFLLPNGGERIVTVNHVEWRLHGKLHREDGPAVESPDGCQWWQAGKLHRVDGPAVEYPGGHQEWWQRGKRHRLDGPAIDLWDETLSWYLDGQVATIEQERRLVSAYRSRTKVFVDDYAYMVTEDDPWVASVVLANPWIGPLLSDTTRSFLALLAGTGRRRL